MSLSQPNLGSYDYRLDFVDNAVSHPSGYSFVFRVTVEHEEFPEGDADAAVQRLLDRLSQNPDYTVSATKTTDSIQSFSATP